MKHVRVFENYNEIGDNDEYLKSTEELCKYFVETYYNGQFKQLQSLLTDILDRGEEGIEGLLDYLSEYVDSSDCIEIKDWIIRKLAEDFITI